MRVGHLVRLHVIRGVFVVSQYWLMMSTFQFSHTFKQTDFIIDHTLQSLGWYEYVCSASCLRQILKRTAIIPGHHTLHYPCSHANVTLMQAFHIRRLGRSYCYATKRCEVSPPTLQEKRTALKCWIGNEFSLDLSNALWMWFYLHNGMESLPNQPSSFFSSTPTWVQQTTFPLSRN